MLASEQLFIALLLNMNGQLRISRQLIKAFNMKSNNPGMEIGKGNSKESEAMQRVQEDFKENVVKSLERSSCYSITE